MRTTTHSNRRCALQRRTQLLLLGINRSRSGGRVMDEFLEALKQQYNEEDIIKGQALLEDIIDITNDGVAGLIAANLFYALMSDELMAFEQEGKVDE